MRKHFLCFIRTPSFKVNPMHSFINEAPGLETPRIFKKKKKLEWSHMVIIYVKWEHSVPKWLHQFFQPSQPLNYHILTQTGEPCSGERRTRPPLLQPNMLSAPRGAAFSFPPSLMTTLCWTVNLSKLLNLNSPKLIKSRSQCRKRAAGK